MNAEWPFTANTARGGRGRRRSKWDEAARATLRDLWSDTDVSTDEIADRFETSRGAIYNKANELGLGRRPRAAKSDFADGKRVKSPKDRTGQRRHPGIASGDRGPRVNLPTWHPALRVGTTLFPTTVIPAGRAQRLLKSGDNSRKLGAVFTKGRWKGCAIYMLTLVERETCPRSCLEWATCYGNNMHLAERILPDETLELRLRGELAHLQALHPEGFVVRLHILGDFFSVAYVDSWRRALVEFPALRIFGFTARIPPDPIGVAIGHMMLEHPDRVMIRFSGAGAESHCSEVVDQPEQVTGTRCPAETSADRSCANCALCPHTDINISFVRH